MVELELLDEDGLTRESEQLVDEDDEFWYTYWPLTMLEKPTAKPRTRCGSIITIESTTVARWKLWKGVHLKGDARDRWFYIVVLPPLTATGDTLLRGRGVAAEAGSTLPAGNFPSPSRAVVGTYDQVSILPTDVTVRVVRDTRTSHKIIWLR